MIQLDKRTKEFTESIILSVNYNLNKFFLGCKIKIHKINFFFLICHGFLTPPALPGLSSKCVVTPQPIIGRNVTEVNRIQVNSVLYAIYYAPHYACIIVASF